jgi:hypothetical protein
MYSKLSDTAMISDNSNVELDEPKIWNCSAAPLLLQLEKEMEDEVKIASSEQGAQVCDATKTIIEWRLDASFVGMTYRGIYFHYLLRPV